MKNIVGFFVALSLSFVSPSLMAHTQPPIEKNEFHRLEYEKMKPDMLYNTKGLIRGKEAALNYLLEERNAARNRFTMHHLPVVLAVTVPIIYLLPYHVIVPIVVGSVTTKVVSPHTTWVSILGFPAVWEFEIPKRVQNLLSLWGAPWIYCACEQFGEWVNPSNVCDTLLKPDILTDLELQLMIQWDRFDASKRLALGNMVFNLRKGQVVDTTAAFDALSNALKLPTHPISTAFDPLELEKSLKGISSENIEQLQIAGITYETENTLEKSFKMSLFFLGTPGGGKSESAVKFVLSLGLYPCRTTINNLWGDDKSMGSVAKCMVDAGTTSLALIFEEVDRGLTPEKEKELLHLSDPMLIAQTDHFLEVEIPLGRLLIIYAVNNAIKNEAFEDRVTTLRFNGFSQDYRDETSKDALEAELNGGSILRLSPQVTPNATWVDIDAKYGKLSAADVMPVYNSLVAGIKAMEQNGTIPTGSMRPYVKARAQAKNLIRLQQYKERHETCDAQGCS